MLGLSNDDIRLFQIENKNPRIECSFSNTSSREYEVMMNASECLKKDAKNDDSSFS